MTQPLIFSLRGYDHRDDRFGLAIKNGRLLNWFHRDQIEKSFMYFAEDKYLDLKLPADPKKCQRDVILFPREIRISNGGGYYMINLGGREIALGKISFQKCSNLPEGLLVE